MQSSSQTLQRDFNNNPRYKPYISSIIFSAYKNIQYGAELTLDFPFTLLLGKNGTNKSSILQALYGCPEGKSVGEYWFSTHVDLIDDVNGKRPAFFYRYIIPETGSTAEVVKTRIQKKGDPDYWEPSRPILEYGMQAMPPLSKDTPLPVGRQKTRWNAIKKDVLYLDFRAEISAFDKAFYKLDRSEARPAHRNKLRKESKPLKEVIDNQLQTKIHYQKERVYLNYEFTEQQRKIVSNILDTEYLSIIYVEHNFYMSGSFSVYLQKGNARNYSEAFAGSGETSVIRLVYAITNAAPGSLVLLDEPETSLHIEAQVRIQQFLLEQIKGRYLQVVISTHSPFFATNLPDNAIKVLLVDDVSKRVSIINSAPADESSFHLGYRRNVANKVNIMVEDSLTHAITQHVFNKALGDSQKDKITITHFSGGKDALLNLAALEMLKASSNVCFLFDGDQMPMNIPDPDTIPPSEDITLKTKIFQIFGSNPNFPFDSNNEQQRTIYYRKYLKFAKERFKYCLFQTPEEFIVNTHNTFSTIQDKSNPKKVIADYVSEKLLSSGEVKSHEILTLQRELISGISLNDPNFIEIKDRLVEALAFAPPVG